MKFRKRLVYLLSISFATLGLLSGCGPSGNNEDGEYHDIGGHPALVTMHRVEGLTAPEGFEESLVYKDENYEQKQKFVFDSKPGEDVRIVNPSPDTITAEEIERDVKVKDAYYVEDPDTSKSLLYGGRTARKKYHLVDANTLRGIDKLKPYSSAILKLEEPTEGGDLTIYEKEEGSPLNFEGKDPSVNELIVATERDEVEEFDPNVEEMKGLQYGKCVDKMDLSHSVEGNFLYSESVGLKEGDQFYIGDNEEFDSDATFYTFIKEEIVPQGYLVTYTVPDYSKCYNQLNIHHDETPINLDESDKPITMPTAEDLIRDIDKDGNINTLLEEGVAQELDTNEELSKSLFGAWKPSISFNLKIKTYIVNVKIGFDFGGPAFCMNFTITFNAIISQSEGGTWFLGGSVSLWFRKTMSTYTDFSVKLLPYPKINYIVCVKTISEVAVNFYFGISYGMKPDKATLDKEKEVKGLQDSIDQAWGDRGAMVGDAGGGGNGGGAAAGGGDSGVGIGGGNNVGGGGDNAPAQSGNKIELDVTANTVQDGDELQPLLTYNSPTPRNALGDDDHDYGGDNYMKKRYSGSGIVISGPGIPVPAGPVTIEFGVSLIFMPDIQGRLFVTYNHVSCDVSAKVVKGFEVPEAYGEQVEYSRSRWVIGLYVKLGFEFGIMGEAIIYVSGCKALFYAAVQVTVGIYFKIQGVGCIIFGDGIDTTFMVYASLEVGFFVRVQIVLNLMDDLFVITITPLDHKFNPFFAFGTNLHFINFVKGKEEFEWVGGHYININDMDILNLTWFSTSNFSVGDGHYDWNFKTLYISVFGVNKKRLFKKLEILEGAQYLTFDSEKGWFEVNDDAPTSFDFKFEVSIDPWLGCTCDSKKFLVHYYSDKLRAISFDGFPNAYEENGIHIGDGLIVQGEYYKAPEMPNKADGTPFVGWLGSNGLFLRPGEIMEVGSTSLSFTQVFMEPVFYMVQFFDGNNSLISSQKIAPGGIPVEPTAEARDAKMNGATFVCWDRPVGEVYSNFNIYGIYVKGEKL